jgi:hypothetical protein
MDPKFFSYVFYPLKCNQPNDLSSHEEESKCAGVAVCEQVLVLTVLCPENFASAN